MRGGRRMRGRGWKRPITQSIQPFMPEHTQNIDMELQLLKQKKEMIEQHQLMLESQKMYDQQMRFAPENPLFYDRVTYNAPGPSQPMTNFNRFYDQPPEDEYNTFNSGGMQQADVWSLDPNPNRFVPERVAQVFGTRLGPKPTQRGPRRSRNTNKPGPPHGNNKDLVLRPNSEPTPKVKGRLGLALGLILKEMRENFADWKEFTPVLFHVPYINSLKTALRQRLTTLMMNKVLGSGDSVFTKYRTKYCVKTDKSLLMKIMRENTEKPRKETPPNDDIISAPINPENYIRNDINKVIDAELNEIVRKLEIINNPRMRAEHKATKLEMESIELDTVGLDENDTEEVKMWKKQVQKVIRQKMPLVLIKNIPVILRCLRLDHVYINTWTALKAKENKMDEKPVHQLQVSIDKETAFAQKFCAKVRGIPILPPKIKQFLEPFKPMWIKKNRYARNLMYVLFRDRNGLDELLQKNGVDLGDCVLRITGRTYIANEPRQKKILQKGKPIRKTNSAKKVVKKAPNESAIASNVPKDLDSRINNLLSSIRKAEENVVDLTEDIIDCDVEIKIAQDESAAPKEGNENTPTVVGNTLAEETDVEIVEQ